MNDKLTIYLDFDGTIVEHEYPKMGRLNFGSLEVIKKLQDKGHKIILNTYRSNLNTPDNPVLIEALEYLNCNMVIDGIVIRETTDEKIHPHPWNLDDCNGEIYIDDIAINIPLKECFAIEGYMVDWKEVERQLIQKQYL